MVAHLFRTTLIGFLILCTMATSSIAQTTIPGGPVSGLWEAPGSPYLIEGEITVPAGDTLTIAPACSVIFQGHYKLIVNGWLLAEGTEEDSIVFTPADTSVGWHGIRLIDAPDGSRLGYCVIEYGKAMGSGDDRSGGGIYTHNSSIMIEHSSIYHNEAGESWPNTGCGGGIFSWGASNIILNECTISENYVMGPGGAIYCQQYANLYISNSIISQNYAQTGRGGIECAELDSALISNCIISNNTIGPGWSTGGIELYQVANAVIDSCEITYNDGAWYAGGIRCRSTSNACITNNIISNNQAGNGGGLYCEYGTNNLISGNTFINNTTNAHGAGIYYYGGLNATIQNCNFMENVALGHGGGVFLTEGASPYIYNCVITDNISGTGGAIAIEENSNPTITNCSIVNNSASSYGGGISISNSSPIITMCDIIENSATAPTNSRGGGISSGGSNSYISNNNIIGNSAVFRGGGIYIGTGGTPSLFNNTILDNNSSHGGGIYSFNESITIVNNIVSLNVAGLNGGGCAFYGSGEITNCTISGNMGTNGGAIIFSETSSIDLLNSTIYGTLGDVAVDFNGCQNANILYCGFYENAEGNFGGTGIPPGLGEITTTNANSDSCDQYYNIFLDPLFTLPDSGNYHLIYGSPCINAGNPDTTYNDPEDPWNLGYALWPALGTITNDMGIYGGPYADDWVQEDSVDAGVYAILAPEGVVNIDTLIVPQAIIYNAGTSEEAIPVTFEVGSFYSDDTTVTLYAGQMDTVCFDTCHIQDYGTFVTSCTVQLAGDENPDNDTMTGWVTVSEEGRPLVYSITPNYGGNTGFVTVEITGSGFADSAVVKLSREGQEDIVAFVTSYIDSTNLTALLVLHDKEIGVYDFIITNPDGHWGIFHDGFSIEVGQTSIWVDLVGPNQVLVGDTVNYWLMCGNVGNINIDHAIIELEVGDNACFFHADSIPFVWWVSPEDTLALNEIGLLISDMTVGEECQIELRLKALSEGDININQSTWVIPREVDQTFTMFLYNKISIGYPDQFPPDPPPLGSVVFQGNYPISGGLGCAHEGIVIEFPPGNVVVWENIPPNGTQLTPWYDFCLRTYPLYPWPSWELVGFWDYHDPQLTSTQLDDLQNWCINYTGPSALPYNLMSKCTEATHTAFWESIGLDLIPGFEHDIWDSPVFDYTVLTGKIWKGLMGNAWAGLNYVLNDEIKELLEEIYMMYLLLSSNNTVHGVNSLDPNDKQGPLGFGEEGYVTQDQTYYYIIHFENADSATANATNIWLEDTLDANLDWATLTFDTSSHEVEISFDSTSGLITWYFEDIQLPPNVNPPEGEGWVMFHVDPLPDLPSGTQILNWADITFDYNDPMRTDTILNTIDALPPSSSVDSLPPEVYPEFEVSWGGDDDSLGSGIGSYSIYVSTNGNPFEIWLANTEDTSATFTGDIDSSYAFCSLAKDNVGHIENKILIAEAITTVISSYPDLEITLTPENPPIQIPASGGSFNYTLMVVSYSGSTESFDLWCDATLPDSSNYGPVLGPVNLTIPSGFSGDRFRTQSVPGGAPAGEYSYNGYIGVYPDTVWDQDSFPFEKLITGDGAWVESWENTGESFEEWMLGLYEMLIPEVYSLKQNFPNPFNSLTTIKFGLPQAGWVTLDIYNLLGQRVVQLVNGNRDAGYHRITWDTSNIGSGIYFYRIQASDFKAVKKMVLVK